MCEPPLATTTPPLPPEELSRAGSSTFPPQATVGQAIDALRELVKHAFITYIYIVDDEERLLGIVTMRDLRCSTTTTGRCAT